MRMNYNIKGTDLSITPEIRSYVEKRLSVCDKFISTDPTVHADVELEFRSRQEGEKYRAEITVTTTNGMHRIEEEGGSLHEAIDLMAGELAKKLGQDKKRKQHFVRESAARFKDFVRGFRDRF